jgi:hypothetical protein
MPIVTSNWQHLIGVESHVSGKVLTTDMLEAWERDPKKQLQCVFCGEVISSMSIFCPGCRDYKGLMPYIREWHE